MNRRDLLGAVIGASAHHFLRPSQSRSADYALRGVSLIRLIANPNVFDGRRLRLAGFLDNNGLDQSVGLYVSESDGRNFIAFNSIDVSIDDATASKFRGQYVLLEGRYHAPKGPSAEYLNGTLDRISLIKAWNSGDLKQ
jgi:hypothetical protein